MPSLSPGLTVGAPRFSDFETSVPPNATVYTAMIATVNAGAFNMNADFSGQTAEGLIDLAIDSANDTCANFRRDQ